MTVAHLCPVCKGHKVIQENAVLTLPIDRGVPEGTEVVFEGEADESPDWEAGNVIIRIKTKIEAGKGDFRRKESGLYWKEWLGLDEVGRGFD